MNYLCVGGPWDGRVVSLAEGQTTKTVPEIPRLPFNIMDGAISSEGVCIKHWNYHVVTLALAKNTGDRIQVLVPHDMSHDEVMARLVQNYRLLA